VIKKEIAMKQKDALGKSSISDQAQHGSKLKLHWYLLFLHEGPWLFNKKMVCEKVEFYDFKLSVFSGGNPFLYGFIPFSERIKNGTML
jgi:hypothetical protein